MGNIIIQPATHGVHITRRTAQIRVGSSVDEKLIEAIRNGLQTKSVTPASTEQVVTADSGHLGLMKVIVAPAQGAQGTKLITTEGLHDIAAYAQVNVRITSGVLTITENGTYDVSKYKQVVVNVEGGGSTVTGKEETVLLSGGTFQNDTITWYCGNGAIKLTQSKGNGATAVNASFIAAPRVYKGHILSFEAQEEGVLIQKIEMSYSGNYRGRNIVAGVSLGTDGNVVSNTDAVSMDLATGSNGTHVFTSNTQSGVDAIYIQNLATSDNVQLRPTQIVITYTVAE